MIDKREILAISQQTSLRSHVVEKDYVLGWMLAGIYGHKDLAQNWVFKGGTCLKKCFFETYRFSEDLDFTLLKPEHLDADFLKATFSEIGDWIYEQTGIEMPAERQEFDVYQNPRGQRSCEGKISYRGPVSHDRQGNRSARQIEAYSLRRSQAGDVLLMAVRADNGESRSYLVDSILGVRATQTAFSPRFSIELTPSGPQSIPQTTNSVSGGSRGVRNTPVIGRSSGRRTRSSSLAGASGPTYVFKCSACGKSFNKKTQDGTLNKHKNSRTGYEYGTFGTYMRMKY